MSKRDYYDVLGVSKFANQDEIKKAYRKLVKQYHPDVNKDEDAPKKFKEVQEAYETLSDDQKKAHYDQFGHTDPNQGFGGFGGGSSGGGFGGFGFDDILSSFFGGGGMRRRDPNAPRKGADLQFSMILSFEEAVFGVEKTISVPREESCETCHGTGAKPGTKPETCSHCNGSGEVEEVQNTPFGRVMNRRACSHCNGTGKIIKDKCTTCHGAGRLKKKRSIKVTIPAGVNDGQQIRLTGQGEGGMNGGPAGDLYVVFTVREHEFFERDGDDIYCELPLTFAQVALGDDVEVPTLYGKVNLKIPAGTQTGTRFRLKNKGIKNVRGYGQGDQHVIVRVVTPTKLTNAQKDKLREFTELSKGLKSEYGKNKSFFDRLKNAAEAFKGD